MRTNWDKFWYEYESIGPILYGGRNDYSKTFRKQRLINIIFTIVTILLFLFIIF